MTRSRTLSTRPAPLPMTTTTMTTMTTRSEPGAGAHPSSARMHYTTLSISLPACCVSPPPPPPFLIASAAQWRVTSDFLHALFSFSCDSHALAHATPMPGCTPCLAPQPTPRLARSLGRCARLVARSVRWCCVSDTSVPTGGSPCLALLSIADTQKSGLIL